MASVSVPSSVSKRFKIDVRPQAYIEMLIRQSTLVLTNIALQIIIEGRRFVGDSWA